MCVYVSGRWVGKKIDYCNGGGVVVMIYIYDRDLNVYTLNSLFELHNLSSKTRISELCVEDEGEKKRAQAVHVYYCIVLLIHRRITTASLLLSAHLFHEQLCHGRCRRCCCRCCCTVGGDGELTELGNLLRHRCQIVILVVVVIVWFMFGAAFRHLCGGMTNTTPRVIIVVLGLLDHLDWVDLFLNIN